MIVAGSRFTSLCGGSFQKCLIVATKEVTSEGPWLPQVGEFQQSRETCSRPLVGVAEARGSVSVSVLLL